MPAPAGPLAAAASFSCGFATVTLGCAVLFLARPALRRSVFASLRHSTELRWWMFGGGLWPAISNPFTVLFTKRLGTMVYYNLQTGGTLLGSLLQDALVSSDSATIDLRSLVLGCVFTRPMGLCAGGVRSAAAPDDGAEGGVGAADVWRLDALPDEREGGG